MEGAILMYGGFLVVASLFLLFDWLGRRKDRATKNRAA